MLGVLNKQKIHETQFVMFPKDVNGNAKVVIIPNKSAIVI